MVSRRRQYKHLFHPVNIGALPLRNRLVMLPLENNYAAADGSVTQRLKDYYRERARDVGLVLVQITAIDSPTGRSYPFQLCIHDDRLIPGLSQLAQVIHQGGAKVIIQLNHAGVSAQGDQQTVAASPIPYVNSPVFHDVTPQELTPTGIKDIITSYVAAAQRAKQAGFDGVEVVASGNYLVWGFLSQAWNQRRDQCGVDLEGRSRLLIEIIREIKASLGFNYPVTCRLAVKDYGPDRGVTLSESQQIARWAEAAGLDGITQTAIGDGALTPLIPGALLPLATAIKQAVTIPVIAAGRMNLDVGERAIAAGKADLIGIGRRFFADPEYVAKSATGKVDDIIPCIACHECVYTFMVKREPLRCAVNPACGQESEYRLYPAPATKKVMVVGGGPAGMEAAIVAARRGHQVTLYEQEPRLGGQLIPAAVAPGKDRIEPFTRYLTNQINKLGVKVKLGIEVTPSVVAAARPDAVVIATGIESIIPDIPGIDKANVAMASDILNDTAEVGMEVVVIDGQTVGCEIAEFLVMKGIKVTMMVRTSFATRMNPTMGRRILNRLTNLGVTMLAGVKYQRFEDNSLVITTKEGEPKTITADTIVIAAGARPNDKLTRAITGHVPEIYSIGDCVAPRNLMEATNKGFRIGIAL